MVLSTGKVTTDCTDCATLQVKVAEITTTLSSLIERVDVIGTNISVLFDKIGMPGHTETMTAKESPPIGRNPQSISSPMTVHSSPGQPSVSLL